MKKISLIITLAIITFSVNFAQAGEAPADHYIALAGGNFGLEVSLGSSIPKTPIVLECGYVIDGPAKNEFRLGLAIPNYAGPTWINLLINEDWDEITGVSLGRSFPRTWKYGKTKMTLAPSVSAGIDLHGNYFGNAGILIFFGI